MKKNINILLFALLGIGVLSCTNKELESRVAALEGKVAELESTNPIAKAKKAAEPEVKPDGPLPTFEFAETAFDFGTIKEGDVVEHVFKFKNTGDAPLIISSATASCGCTVPVWPKDPIPIGEEGEIQVRFNSKGKSGNNNKTVTITANTYPKISRLNIKANVNKEEDPS